MVVVDQAASGNVRKNLYLPVYGVLVGGSLRYFFRVLGGGGLAEGIPTKQLPHMLYLIVSMYLLVLF